MSRGFWLQGPWQLNVEQLLSNIEVAKQQNQLFAALKAGNQAVAELQTADGRLAARTSSAIRWKRRISLSL